MSTQARASLLLLGLCCGALSCSPEGDLGGSMERFYDLSYAQVRARQYPTELAIEYVREDAQVPVRVTVRVAQIKVGEPMDLKAVGSVSGRTRDTDLPDLRSGTLTLERYEPRDGAPLKGSFVADFLVGRDRASLTGRFDTTLEIVPAVQGFDLGYIPDMGDMGEMGEMGEMTSSP